MQRRALSGCAALAAAFLLACPAPVRAQTSDSAPFRVTVNHAEVITLPAPAAVALIANPDIADVVSEQHNLIFVLGRKPGATNLIVYDDGGKRLFSREVLVVPESSGMVTITRETDTTDYYCEPRCRFYEHEQGGTPPAPPVNAGPAVAGGTARGAPGQGGGGATVPAAPSDTPGSPPPYIPSVTLRPGNF
jgi:hypothetical protein